ncbi:Uncharacterised protein [Escherichia coli]|uniref:Uncharacterized protein n=1 Tax=Escherichia coli TaxID=562 RepID=A0A376RI18_ECOLX|nr:Uncharacterised protein [Escherichia coli]
MLYLRSWRSDICPPRDSRYTCGFSILPELSCLFPVHFAISLFRVKKKLYLSPATSV